MSDWKIIEAYPGANDTARNIVRDTENGREYYKISKTKGKRVFQSVWFGDEESAKAVLAGLNISTGE